MVYIDSSAKRGVSTALRNTHPDGIVYTDKIIPVHCLLFCLEGSMEIYQNGVPCTIYQNDVLFLCGGTAYCDKRICAKNTKLYTLHIGMAENDFYSSDDLICQGPMIKISPIIHCAEESDVRTMFASIIDAFWGNSEVREQKLASLAGLLLIRLSECSENVNEKELTGKCALYIKTQMDRFLTPNELAQKFDVPEKTLRTAFIRDYGCTPAEYQRKIKMQYAVSLMKRTPDMQIKEIAYSIGYRDEFYFTRMFRKYYGEAPREYRKKLAVTDNSPPTAQRNIPKRGFPLGQVTDGFCYEQKRDKQEQK